MIFRRILLRLMVIVPFYLIAYWLSFTILSHGSGHLGRLLKLLLLVLAQGLCFIVPRVVIKRRSFMLASQLILIFILLPVLQCSLWQRYQHPLSDMIMMYLPDIMEIAIICVFISLTNWTLQIGTSSLLLALVLVIDFIMNWGFRGFGTVRMEWGAACVSTLMFSSLAIGLIVGDYWDINRYGPYPLTEPPHPRGKR